MAGPVTVAAVLLTTNYELRTKKINVPLRDSKKLSPKQREFWFDYIKKQKIPYAVANVSQKIIDRINISNAANLAATRALNKLLTTNKKLLTPTPLGRGSNRSVGAINCRVYLDGGLKISPKFSKSLLANGYTLNTIIRGDEKISAIMFASIVAKVRRDNLMKRVHKKYPRYGFKKHKGYGTKLHYRALKLNGASKIHRKSFLSSLKKEGR